MVEKVLVPVRGYSLPPPAEETGQGLNISVLFTSAESTVAAIKHAGALAASLGARITLLVAQVVPYPLPLESPPVLVEFNETRFRAIACQCSVETTVRIYLCRDAFQTLAAALRPGSIVVVGGRRRWWPTAEKRLARRLHRYGHEVIWTETE